MLLLFWCLIKREAECKEPAILRCTECVPPLEDVDDILGVGLQWVTADSAGKMRNVEDEEDYRDTVEAAERSGLLLFRIILSRVQTFSANRVVHLLTRGLSLKSSWLYIHRFFWRSRIGKCRIHATILVYLILVLCRKITCTR